MIVCPNCNHSNPDGSPQCESCHTPLPAAAGCPECGASVPVGASFCGQCGASLAPRTSDRPEPTESEPTVSETTEVTAQTTAATVPDAPTPPPQPAVPPAPPSPNPPAIAVPDAPPTQISPQTVLQAPSAQLVHNQTDTTIALPPQPSVFRIGKLNARVPPDLDVSGFPHSEIVSRVHAEIRLEGQTYYIEDVGSSNGTYVNHLPLARGNRHPLKAGDRIALGKGDLVTFVFQLR